MRKRPFVLHVAAVEYTVEHLLMPQLEHFSRLGIDVAVACGWDHKHPSSTRLFDRYSVPIPRRFEPRAHARAMWSLIQLVREVRPDAVHFHSPAAALAGRPV